MVNGPPCSTCGYPLRWLAPQNAWGCDRCQKLFPAQQAPQPPMGPPPSGPPPSGPPLVGYAGRAPTPPYSPFPQAAKTQAIPQSARKTSRKKIAIGLSIAALAIAGGVIMIVVATRKDPGLSREAVIKQTFAALAEGNADKLYRLADPANMLARIADCEKLEVRDDDDKADRKTTISNDEAEFRDPERIKVAWMKEANLATRRSKGATFEVVEILTKPPRPLTAEPVDTDEDDEDDDSDEELVKDDDEDKPERDKKRKVTTIRKGKKLMKGCVAKTTIRTQEVKVKVKVEEDDREFTQTVVMSLHEIGGRWYLGMPPRLNVGLDVVTEDLEAWRDQACKCKDGACIEKLDEEHKQLQYIEYSFDKDEDLPVGGLAKLTKVNDERKVCENTAKGGLVLAKHKELAERMCACKDEKCSEAVTTDLTAWTRKLSVADREIQRTLETNGLLAPISQQFSECAIKLAATRIRLDSIYPTTGDAEGGTYVTLRGRSFTATPRSAKVYFGAVEGTLVRFVSDYELIVQAPAGVADQVADIMVVFDPGGVLRLPAAFTYISSKLLPNPGAPSSCERLRKALERGIKCTSLSYARGRLSTTWSLINRMVTTKTPRKDIDTFCKTKQPLTDEELKLARCP